VRIGFAVPISGVWATPEIQVRVVRCAEELGYHSVWTLQRLLVPEHPDERGGNVAYRSILDAIVPLAFLAGQTSRIRLGLSVVNMPFIAPAVLAKQLTTLDILSAGRLDVGLGIGWMPQEYVAAGAPYRHRGARAEEFIAALRALWTQEVVEFHGDFYEIPRSRVEPKPQQRPHPPLLLGGAADAALRRAGRLADGWASSSGADLKRLGDSIQVVREAALQAGRDPAALRFVCRGPLWVRPAGAAARRPLTGSFEEIRRDLDDLREQGVTEVFLDMNYDPEIVAPGADPAESLRRAERALEALAPARPGSAAGER
jgi:probable F420-dependent oxidoreductase